MRSAYAHIASRARQVIVLLCISFSLSAQNFSADRELLNAYLRQDMSVWKAHIDTVIDLPYEYGFCGYMVDRDKSNALPYVKRFKEHISAQRNLLPKGHYEMYISAVYVYELRLHQSIHPVKAMSLAKEAVKRAPNDPVVLSYYGTCLFYAPKPFGSKQEALIWFEKADSCFNDRKWDYCWMKEANSMYIRQCKEKLEKQ